MKDESGTFMLGVLFGMFLLAFLFWIWYLLPWQVEEQWKQKVEEHGYGEYVVKDKAKGTVQFQWANGTIEGEEKEDER